MIVLDWIKRRMGYHVCDEFTQWETHEIDFENTVIDDYGEILTQRRGVRRWQERRCTTCGIVQQRRLEL